MVLSLAAGPTIVVPPVSAAAVPVGAGHGAQPDPVLPVKDLKPNMPSFPKMKPLAAKPVVWPNTAAATLPVASRSGAPAAVLGGLPVAVEPVASDDNAGVASAAPGQVRVEVVSHEESLRAGYPVAVRLSSADSGGGRIRVTLSYAAFRDAYGADWDNRLTLVQVTPCALSTPAIPKCSQATPLATVNDYRSATVSADVDISKVTQTRVLSPKQAALEGAPEATVTSEPVVVGIMAGGSSDIGDYTKTDYHPDFSWQAGSNSGDFSLSYPITTPPVPAALAPEVTLSYSSGNVDGQTVGVNVQPFWGEGWNYSPGYVERAYRSCKDEVANSPKYTITTSDNCFRLPNARMLLGGKSVELILGNDGVWRAENDDVAKVELLTGGTGTGLYNNERWKVSTVDGSVYYFGLTRLPGWTTGDRETNSALGEPVYSNHNGDPCIDAQGVGWTTSWCQMAYRWNLDYVVDRNGNTMSFWYTKETNKTALAGNASYVTTYDRFGLLDHIEYGTRSGTGTTREPRPGATPPAKVVFGYADRCLTASCGTHDRANWPDTPWDLDCTSTSCANNMTPSFWSTRRASLIATEVYSGSATTYNRVDEWAFGADFPADASGNPLWLTNITHTGKVGGSLTTPSLQFFGTRFRNRADWDPNGTMADPQKYRITSVRNETGGQIDVTYDAQDPGCQFGSPFPDPDNNYFRCFARRWVNPTGDLGWAWWHKYVVKTVVEKDLVGGAPDKTTSYSYDLAGAGSTTGPVVLWAYDKGGSVFATSTGFRSWADWRGYPTVTTTVGTVAGQQSQTRTLYFRGLNGDRTDNGYYARNATVTNSLGEVTNDEPTYAGMMHESQTLDGPGGQVLTKTITDPSRYLTGTRDMTNSWAIPPTQWSYITRPTRERQMTWLPASSSWLTTDKTTTWNTTYGVVDTVSDLGAPGTGDDLCTRYSFTFPAAGAPYLAQYPNRVQTVGVACTATPVYPQDAVSDTRSYYDGATSSTTAPTAGNVTKVESAVSYTGSTPNYVKRQTSSYDVWGRVTSVKDGLDHQTTTAYTQNATGLTATVTVANALSHQAVTNLDVNRGVPLTVVDANTKTTTLNYDPLGQLTKVWRPGHPTNGTPDSEYQYTLQATGPSFIRTRTLGPNGNQIDSYDIYDGLLRPRQRQTTAPSGKRLVAETVYDRRGLAEKASTYYDSANPPLSTLATLADGSIDQQTRYVYDQAGRQTATELWSRNALKWRTVTSYGGDRVNTDEPVGGVDTAAVYDARGRQTQLRQYRNATDYDTATYTYDRQGKLTGYSDAVGNQWTFTFDLLGRKTTAAQPDAGTTTYGYDAGDRQTSVQDALGVVLAYGYDDLNRKTGAFEGSLAGTKRAEWVYDSIAKGHLTSATRFDGGNAYINAVNSYDDNYQPLSTTNTVPGFGTGGGALTYTVTNTYKTNGALATLSVPAVGGLPAETLTNAYSDQGMPTTTSGLNSYISSTTFSFDGQVTEQILGAPGKQVKLSAAYDAATRRLSTQNVDLETATPGTFAAKYGTDYGYDQVGNITNAGTFLDGTRDQMECYRYDYLRRLSEAWSQASYGSGCITPQRAGADPYWRQWTYDTIGNRLTQTDKDPSVGDTTWTNTNGGTACGAPAKPHQVTAISASGPKAGPSRSFCYDATGNTTSRTSTTGTTQTLTWDKEGHLATLVEGTSTTSYVYDADGTRLIARTPSKSMLYLPDGTELELPAGGGAALATRYYSGIAVRDASGLKWTMANHQGSGTIQIDAVSLASSRRRFLPYGEDRTATPTGWIGSKGYVGGTKDNTGLTHLGAREYDPTTGRFASTDPVGDVGSSPQQWNVYAYANDNPVTFADPDGNIVCGDEGCNLVASVNPSGGYYVSGKAQSYVAPCAPNCKPPKPPTKQQQDWIDKYNEAVDNAFKNHKEMAGATGLDKLARNPGGASQDILDRYQTIIEYEFCQLVPDCLNAFKYFYTVSAMVLVTGANGSPVENNESANIVREAADRQLAKGWDELIDKNLNDKQKAAYQDLLDRGQYYKARGFLGTALHNAVYADLESGEHKGRFEYTSNRRPDFYDTKTRKRVELTTQTGFAGHVERGGLYKRATYVLYKGPGRLPSIRVGGVGGAGAAPGSEHPGVD